MLFRSHRFLEAFLQGDDISGHQVQQTPSINPQPTPVVGEAAYSTPSINPQPTPVVGEAAYSTPTPVTKTKVVFTDTDGDTVEFRLDGNTVTQYVNGKKELENVTYLLYKPTDGSLHDREGHVVIQHEPDRGRVQSELQELFEHASGTFTTEKSAPEYVDGDKYSDALTK